MPRGGQNRGSGKAPKAGGKLPRGRGRNGAPPRLTLEQYQKMWESYCQHQSISKAAEAAGCTHKTARKYIDGDGAPEKGLHPIHERWLEVERKARRKADTELVRSRANNLKIVRLAKAKFSEKLLGDFDLSKVNEDRIPQSLKDLIILEERLLGADDIKVGLRQAAGGEFAGWTLEEILEFAKTGREPAREVTADEPDGPSS